LRSVSPVELCEEEQNFLKARVRDNAGIHAALLAEMRQFGLFT